MSRSGPSINNMTVHQLVDRWGWLNLGTAAIPLAGALCALWALVSEDLSVFEYVPILLPLHPSVLELGRSNPFAFCFSLLPSYTVQRHAEIYRALLLTFRTFQVIAWCQGLNLPFYITRDQGYQQNTVHCNGDTCKEVLNVQ